MKKQVPYFFWFCCTSLLVMAAYGQKKNIPDSVRTHFQSAYPKAEVKDWNKEKDGSMEVEFILNGKEWEACYTAGGAWLRTERDITRAEIPQGVWEGLSKSNYAAWKVDDLEEHQTPQHKLVYEIEVKQGSQKANLYFLPDGTMVK